MLFNKQKFLTSRIALILVLLGGMFGVPFIHPVHASTVENSHSVVPGAKMQAISDGTNVPLVSLTFDDGAPSVYDTAFPILSSQGIPATFYFITDWLTEPWKIQLRDLENHGWEIGSHTVTHTALDTLTPQQVNEELSQSKADLEAAGLTVTGFAYPYGAGSHDPSILQAIAQEYTYARSTNDSYNSMPLDTYALFAQAQDSSVSLETMKGWVDTAIATNQWVIILMHQVDDTGGVYSVTPADLTALASYIKTKVDAGSIRAVTVQDGFDLYNSSAPTCYALTLSHTGQGSNPTASPLKSAACPTNGQYVYGTAISLSGAAPSTGWQISNWTGTENDSSTASTNLLIMRAGNRTASVNYTPREYTLAVISAHGTVTKNPNKATYTYGDVVQLTTVPVAGWSFANWTGDATGTNNPVSITMNGNRSVTANYTQYAYTLTLTSEHGTVTKNPDKPVYTYGEVVQLTAKPMSGWMFASWSGDVTGTANPLSVTMTGNKSVKANYVRSGADTTGVFRPSNGALYLKNKNETGYADVQINYGIGGDYPIVGDWDGDGKITIGIYRDGSFYLRNENTIGFADVVFPFGMPGDQPVAGDWDGDGIDTIGVYRNGLFLLRNSNSAGAPDASFALGMAGDVGIAGDWDGDGKDTTGVFRPSNGALYLKYKNETGYADVQINYGIGGDKPVVGDWNNDGIDTIGVYRNGQFMLRNSNTIGYAEIVFALGIPGDMPIAGNWDGLP